METPTGTQDGILRALAEKVMTNERNLRSFDDLEHFLGLIANTPIIDRFRQLRQASATTAGPLTPTIPRSSIKRFGMHMTPKELAEFMASLLPDDSRAVMDFSCGEGALLAAAVERAPKRTVIGVEQDATLALAAALRVCAIRRNERDEFRAQDGLHQKICTLGDENKHIILNPPYLGEKFHREIFQDLRRTHPDLQDYFGPRMDLLYLFLHRAIDCTTVGASIVLLTPPYWLRAEGARALRNRLRAETTPLLFAELGAGRFRSAPGHHSLVTLLRRGRDESKAHYWRLPGEEDDSTDDCPGPVPAPIARDNLVFLPGSRPVRDDAITDSYWAPAATIAAHDKALLLGDLVMIRQGFVSGADRVTQRHRTRFGVTHDVGHPVFLFHEEEFDPAWPAASLMRPVFRSRDCSAGMTFSSCPSREFVLYIDGELESSAAKSAALEHLAPFRALLEERREVKLGVMPWYRLHWPRSADEQDQPKLITPRRAPRPQFCLDLSGARVSSDCTYMLAPPNTDDPRAWLAKVMVVLNSEAQHQWWAQRGRKKGHLIEFYGRSLEESPYLSPEYLQTLRE